MDSALERMKDNLRDAEGESRKAFEVRVAKVLCRYYEIRAAPKHPLFGLQWFRDHCDSFPMNLDAQRINVNIDSMFRAITRTPAWKAYMHMLIEYDFEPCALVVTYKGQGLYVLHNNWSLTPIAGHTRLVRRAKSSNYKGAIFEPLEAFLTALTGRNPI